jgi:hypothetical protein
VVTVFSLSEALNIGAFSDDLVMGSIYLPLVPWALAEIDVLADTPQLFRPPSLVGWMLVVSTWTLIWAMISYGAVRLWPAYMSYRNARRQAQRHNNRMQRTREG